jgi:hypothetical protein
MRTSPRRGIELVAFHRAQEPVVQFGTVFVPDGALRHFFERFQQYAEETTEKGATPQGYGGPDRCASKGNAAGSLD